MKTHSSILAWRIPWTEDPGVLQSTGVTQSQTQLKWLSMVWHYFSICPRVVMGLLDHMVILFLVFWGNSTMFSIGATPTYIRKLFDRDYTFTKESLQPFVEASHKFVFKNYCDLQLLWKSRAFPQKLVLTNDPATPLLAIDPRSESKEPNRHLYACVDSSAIHNSQKVETTHVFIDRWMDKQNIGCIYNGILFSIKKEWNSDNATAWMNLEDIILSEISQTYKMTNIVWFHLHEVPGNSLIHKHRK